MARTISQKDELDSFSNSLEAERDVFGKPSRSLSSLSSTEVRLFSAFVGKPDSCTWR